MGLFVGYDRKPPYQSPTNKSIYQIPCETLLHKLLISFLWLLVPDHTDEALLAENILYGKSSYLLKLSYLLSIYYSPISRPPVMTVLNETAMLIYRQFNWLIRRLYLYSSIAVCSVAHVNVNFGTVYLMLR